MRRRIDFVIILALDLLILAGIVVYLAAPHMRGRISMHGSQAPAALRVKV